MNFQAFDIIEFLQETYQEWWNKSRLTSLYLIGSITTGEYSVNDLECPSDIDLLAITDNARLSDKIQIFRNEINIIWKKNNQSPIRKIGLKIKKQSELFGFQDRMISWGYNMKFSKRIFGSDLLPTFESHTETPIITTIDNLLERIWYDIYCIEKSIPYTTPKYVSAKSILYGINFILISNAIFHDTYLERIESFRKLGFCDQFCIEPQYLQECYKIKTGENSVIAFHELDRIRDSFFDQIWEFLLSKLNFEFEYSLNTGYWKIDESILKNSPLEPFNTKLQYNEFIGNKSIFYRFLIYQFSSSLNKMRIFKKSELNEQLIMSIWNNFFLPQSKGKLTKIDAIKFESIPEIVSELEYLRLYSICESPIIYI